VSKKRGCGYSFCVCIVENSYFHRKRIRDAPRITQPIKTILGRFGALVAADDLTRGKPMRFDYNL
jgi:hypothetical protein